MLAKLKQSLNTRDEPRVKTFLADFCHIDGWLMLSLLMLIGLGLIILYSAGSEDIRIILRQTARLGIAVAIMLVFAQIPPKTWQLWAPYIYILGASLLVAVLILGVIGKGAQRWLDLKVFRFQPSEIMKLAIPLLLAWYFNRKSVPPTHGQLCLASIAILIPVIMTAKQPDLGTAIMLTCSGACVLFLAGLSWRLILTLGTLATFGMPILWMFMHDYQRQRVLTFLNPESDPLGSGYHIIQSKIAIGSGGIWGKGWMQGTQSQLDYLPEHTTDFIFAVASEDFGLLGVLALLAIYLLIVFRGLYISIQAQDTFGRLLAGSLSLTFFFSFFVNIGMVSGILPVVGIPLPLVSYGGTSMVTLLAGFGLIMSIHTHRKIIAH